MTSRTRLCISAFFTLLTLQTAYAVPDKTQLAVWANEAIIATYTYDAENFLNQQKTIAKYFTANGWTAYSEALHKSDFLEQLKKNKWQVNAVATMPPVLSNLDAKNWKVEMPVLVTYKNDDITQKQNLQIKMTFAETPAGQGVRGLGITSMNTEVIQPPCECKN